MGLGLILGFALKGALSLVEIWKFDINCFPFLLPLPSLRSPSATASIKDLEFSTIGFKTELNGCLMASDPGAIAFRRWNPKPRHPLPDFPSDTTRKPFQRPWISSEIIKKLPCALEPNCKIKTFSPSFKVHAKLPGVVLDIRSSTIASKCFAPYLPMKTNRSESRFHSKMHNMK